MILLDTNILVHAAGAQSLRHAKAKELRDQAAAGQFEACIAAQVLTEFYAVVTDPRRFQPPLTPIRKKNRRKSTAFYRDFTSYPTFRRNTYR